MAAVSLSRRATAGIVFIVAGALLAIALILPLVGVSGVPWLVAIAYAAITVAFVILGVGAVNSTLAKITLIAAAVGWALLTISALGVSLPSPLGLIAALLAGIGGLIAAIVLYVGREIRNLPAILFIVTTALGLLYLLGAFGVFSLGSTLALLIALAFAAGLIVTGVLFRQPERRGR